MNISIITPILNEQKQIPEFLDTLQGIHHGEHILVDGGSTDLTRHLTESYPVKLIVSLPGRGIQQNAGAEAATGDILLFLHCDTRLPANFEKTIRQTLQQSNTVAGAFLLAINAPGCGYRLIEKGANLRSRWLGLPYGDQALFMKKKAFMENGGFPNQPIGEEFSLLRRLRKRGKIVLAPAAVSTSARRWQRLGLLRTTLINQIILVGMLLRIPPGILAKLYF